MAKISVDLRNLCFFCAIALLSQILPLQGQSTSISNPITIPLEAIAVPNSSGGTFYKYGIYATVGGATTPQIFEFDTGGDGFYAAYAEGTGWWGGNVLATGTSVTNTYDSGNQLVANAVQTGISFYGAPGSSSPLLTTSNTILVGQTTNISNTNSGTTTWPVPLVATATPPVDNYFYGDFGVSLKPGTAVGTNSIANVFAQFQYTNNVVGGYIVHTGPAGATNAYVQVGVTTNDISSFPILLQMQGQNTNSYFPGTTNSTYSAELINVIMTLAGAYTNSIPLNLDTGNPTPGLHNPTNGVPSNYIVTDENGSYLDPGLSLDLTADEINGSSTNVFSIMTDTNYGTDYVYVQDKNNFYLNIGVPFFQEWDVLFDFEDGIVGLRPSVAPEASQMTLAALGIAGLWFFAVWRSMRRKRKMATVN